MIGKIVPFLIAAGIGLAIGIERERRYANTQTAMGVRTFTLIALLGALASYVREPMMALGCLLFAAGLIIASYLRKMGVSDPEQDIGLTTEFAAGTVFVIGYLTQTEPFLSAVLGLLILIVLLSRDRLHEFTLQKIRSEEIQAAVVLFVLGIGVLPLLPSEPVDPWGLLDLHRFVMLILLIGSVQFIGYLATRVLGSVIGFPLSGFVSGFISSTAVFLVMPGKVKENPKLALAACSAAVFAIASTFLFLCFLVSTISADLAFKISPPLLSSVAIAVLSGFIFARFSPGKENFPEPKNPLSIVGTLKLGVLLGGFILAVGLIQRFTGSMGAQLVSFIAGLGELHGVSIASASLFAGGKIPLEAAQTNILLAALGSLVSKVLIALMIRQKKYTPAILSAVLLMIGASFLVWWLF